jgi:hypothetical protein
VDRDELLGAVRRHPALDRTPLTGIEPASEDRRPGLYVRRIARLSDDERTGPARIDAVELDVVDGGPRPDVDRELVPAVTVQIRRREYEGSPSGTAGSR